MWFATICNFTPGGSDIFFWSLRALYTRTAQTSMQANYIHIRENQLRKQWKESILTDEEDQAWPWHWALLVCHGLVWRCYSRTFKSFDIQLPRHLTSLTCPCLRQGHHWHRPFSLSLLWCSLLTFSPLHFSFAVWRWNHTVLQQSLLCLVCMRIHEKPKGWCHHIHTYSLVLGRYRVSKGLIPSWTEIIPKPLKGNYSKYLFYMNWLVFPLNISNPVFFFLHYLYLSDFASF